MKVHIKKLSENAVIPSYAKPGDAGMDLTVTRIINKYDDTKVTYGFGLALEIPEGFLGLVFPRSSVKNYSIMLSNSVGVIDSEYRGEVMATFNKLGNGDIYQIGDRAAQLIILPYPSIEFEEVDNLSDTERGTGGFGSSGK